jgi:uncharacterized protein
MLTNRARTSLRALMIGVMAVFGLGVATPAWAIDCSKASDPIDKRICGNASLKAADAAMGRAYGALIKTAPDTEIRSMLVGSQRRWIGARNEGLNTDSQGAPRPIGELRKAIEERTKRLNDHSDKGLVAQAEAQRRFLTKYTGGDFSGFDTSCEFIPNDRDQTSFSYQCFGTMHVQNKLRVCSANTEWATWSLAEYYGVSTVEGGTAKSVASCSDQSGNICEKGKDTATDSDWSLNPGKDVQVPAPQTGLPKLDVEGIWPLEATDATWFDQCLTSPAYPPTP